MSIGSFLYTMLIGPLNLLLEMVFSVSNKLVSNPGYAIIILSIVVNILLLPLYNRAEKLQSNQREKEIKLQPGIDHIKRTFKGEERFMMLQTYYRQNNYSPLQSLNGAMSLFLQIPFFLSAYGMLSSLRILNGTSFLFIKDLGSPDGILSIGSFSINILPILMTIINIISGTIYTKDLRFKDRMRIYLMALVFLVLLYNSPAGLAFYWTLNNLFSLGKNTVLQLKKNFVHEKKSDIQKTNKPRKKHTPLPFILAGVCITALVGLTVPAALISSSPTEFIVPSMPKNPTIYVTSSIAYSLGIFVVWLGLIYYLASDKIRNAINIVMPPFFLVLSYNFFNFFGVNGKLLTNLSLFPRLGSTYTQSDTILNIVTLLVLILVSAVLYKFLEKILNICLIIGIIFFIAIGSSFIMTIDSEYEVYKHPTISQPTITLSSNKKNTVVIMLDRAQGTVFEDIFEQYPSVCDTLDGFTFYPNTASFGGHTNIAIPALYGGYEYVPFISDNRSDVYLSDKHNESLLLMPRVFADNDYDVTVINPTYAGYQEVPDITIYDSYANINAYYTGNILSPGYEEIDRGLYDTLMRNFFCYSMARCAPLAIAPYISDLGSYNPAEYGSPVVQRVVNMTEASGIDYLTSLNYNVLNELSTVTRISDTSNGGFLVLANDLTHMDTILQEPYYTLTQEVHNSNTFTDKTPEEIASYETSISSIYVLSNWFNYLKSNNCYDNTKIIIVSDHGYLTSDVPGYAINDYDNLGYYRPLLLVKDYNAHGFTVSDEFMTNADTPTIAFADSIDNPINPFTGNPINNSYKDNGIIAGSASHDYSIRSQCGTTYKDEGWYVLTNKDVRDANNWVYYPSYEDIPQ